MSQTVQQQIQLPLKKAVRIAWRNIRVRWWRSMLVTSGIILALAFLTYVLCSAALVTSILRGPEAFLQELQRANLLSGLQAAGQQEQQTQTRWIVGLALLVAFVGIMNAMLMSVTERFREIGTMKCLGALDTFVIKLFMIESVFQGISGATLGVIIGLLLATIEGTLTYGLSIWRHGLVPLSTFGSYACLCLLAGVMLTIVGAIYPAWRAARMQPVEAMRAEV